MVITDQPLKGILGNPDVSRRLLKWVVELNEFDVQYQPRAVIKAQETTNFVAEFTPTKKVGSQKEGSSAPAPTSWSIVTPT